MTRCVSRFKHERSVRRHAFQITRRSLATLDHFRPARWLIGKSQTLSQSLFAIRGVRLRPSVHTLAAGGFTNHFWIRLPMAPRSSVDKADQHKRLRLNAQAAARAARRVSTALHVGKPASC